MKKNYFLLLVFGFVLLLTGCVIDDGINNGQEKEKTYSIQYGLGGGSLDGDAPRQYQNKDLPLTLPIPIKPGSTFGGWYRSNDYSGGAVDVLVEGTTGNIILYAKWEEEQVVTEYEINYILDGGNLDGPTIFTTDDLPLVLMLPTKEGYEFDGWYLDQDFTIQITQLNERKNYILFAKWIFIEESFTITYHLNGGINHLNNPNTINESNLPFTLFTPTRSGFDFLGWYDNSGFNGEQIKTITNIDGDLNLYAKWERIPESEYSITYNLNGGTNHPDNPVHYTESSLPVALQMPTRDGYVFMGWYLESDFSGNKITGFVKGTTGNKIVYAKWEQSTPSNIEVLVLIAEHSRLQSDFDLALQGVASLPDGSQKQGLLNRLTRIEIIEDDVIRDDSTIID